MEPSKLDGDLHEKLADLDIVDLEQSSASKEPPISPRILRKRKSPDIKISTNRRVSMKPRKNNFVTESANSKQIEALYLNKKFKKTMSQTLETIYEEPKPNNSEPNGLIGGRKIKRLLTFQIGSHYTKDKIKRRREKIKRLLGNKSFLNRKKIPMNVFLKTIEESGLNDVSHLESHETITVQ
ncbi:unnamed protein product [Leptosia nina]|uniref:Tantalus-like domain-containing protein n=1 Tax=Leptosia nina TaxID=320188 RepID=A0AAV1J9C8_9NEOP